MDEGIIDESKKSYGLMLKYFQNILTVFYLLTIAIGMIFSYCKYEKFGINIYEYSNLFDFLIAPFNDLRILLFAAVTILFTYLFYQLNSWQRKRFPKFYSRVNFGMDKKSWFDYYIKIGFACIFCFYLYLSGVFYGELVEGQIEKREVVELKYIDNTIIEGTFIGKSSEVIFLKTSTQVVAIPFASVLKEIEIASRTE